MAIAILKWQLMAIAILKMAIAINCHSLPLIAISCHSYGDIIYKGNVHCTEKLHRNLYKELQVMTFM